MSVAIRNDGHGGLGYMAISAVDAAFWDLKGKILGISVCQLIGRVREEALVYGSGGFTSYPDTRLEKQLASWADMGFSNVKMKIGREHDRDLHRVKLAREAIGDRTGLFVDANGAYTTNEALRAAFDMQGCGVTWFEEPVSSDNRVGLRFIRDHGPAGMRVAAGEYGYALDYFLTMLQSGSVDVLQADATRCGGISGFLKAGYTAEAFQVPFSFHCAPALHLHAAVCLPGFYIGEYFHDHARIEELLFDGAPVPRNGKLKPDLLRSGLGISLKGKEAEKYRIG
jgi:L-alanine-DL-glutamate epimerase-like enolase superfamily enzyme